MQLDQKSQSGQQSEQTEVKKPAKKRGHYAQTMLSALDERVGKLHKNADKLNLSNQTLRLKAELLKVMARSSIIVHACRLCEPCNHYQVQQSVLTALSCSKTNFSTHATSQEESGHWSPMLCLQVSFAVNN